MIGCILPETVLSGHHHNPFRTGNFLREPSALRFGLDEIWRVEKGTFKNEAIILFGRKEARSSFALDTIPGQQVTSNGLNRIQFTKIVQGNRVAWSDRPTSNTRATGFFQPAEFRQGADIMPRTLIFHEFAKLTGRQWSVGPISRQTSPLRYLVTAAKTHKTFSLPNSVISDAFIFDVLMSNHLTSFDIIDPAKALLPIQKSSSGTWQPVTTTFLATQGTARQTFARIFSTLRADFNTTDFFNMIDSNRRKLTAQLVPNSGWLVLMGAGGDYVCAAYTDITNMNVEKLIIDQTLYWVVTPTQEEAIYLAGALNSDAVNEVIKEFQPRGQFGARHVHTLPIGVTPKYDPDDVAHIDVVAKTTILLNQWTELKISDTTITNYLDPNQSLAQRRSKIRKKLATLPGYVDYSDACKALYSVE